MNTFSEMLLKRSTLLFKQTASMLANKPLEEISGDLFNLKTVKTFLKPSTPLSPAQLSIIIPSYNRQEFILDALESTLNQGLKKLEVIIVNDGGQAFDSELLEKARSFNFPVTLIEHTENHGLAASRNTGALHACGKWLCFLDDDDVLLENALGHLVNQAENGESQFVFGDHVRQYFDAGTKLHSEYHSRNESLEELLAIENRICCGSFIINRAFFCSLKGYSELLRVHEDYNLHIRAAKTTKLSHIARPVFQYNIRTDVQRMNINLRLYWFATSSFNHELYCHLISSSPELKNAQRINQYQHLARALKEGCKKEDALNLLTAWWKELERHSLNKEIETEFQIMRNICPELAISQSF